VPKLLMVFWGFVLFGVGIVWGETEFTYLENSDLSAFGNFQGAALGDAGEETFLYLTRQDDRGTLFSWKNSRARDITENLPEAAGEPGAEGGAAWIDYNGDGWQDLYISRFQRPNLLYKNRGLDMFEEVADHMGLDDPGTNQGMAWADFDADGDLDLYLTNFGFPNRLYLNENGSFREVGEKMGVDDDGRGLSAAWGDFNGDGDLDLYVINYGQVNRLYQYNKKDSVFVEVAQRLKVRDSGKDRKDITAAWVDFDNDGDLDLSLTRYGEPNRLYQNNREQEEKAVPFEDVAQQMGLDDRGQGQMMAWADYDRDGDQDVYVVNGGDQTADLSWLYQNGQGEQFVNVSTVVGLTEKSGGARRSKGAIWWDMDEDGALDLYVVNFRQESRVYRNTRNETTGRTDIWLSARLRDETPANRYGIGSKLRVKAGGVKQVHYLGLSANYLSQGSQRLLVGLPSGRIDSLVVEWPDGYKKDVKDRVSINTPSSQIIRRSKAKLSVSIEEEIKFGKIPVGEKKGEEIIISNDGEADLEIEDISISSEAGTLEARRSSFKLENVKTSFSIAPDSSYQFGVHYSPKEKIKSSASLIIRSSEEEKQLVLKGEGSSEGYLIVEPDPIIIDLDSRSGRVSFKKAGSGHVEITGFKFVKYQGGKRITNSLIPTLNEELKQGKVLIEKERVYEIRKIRKDKENKVRTGYLIVEYEPGRKSRKIRTLWTRSDQFEETLFEKIKPHVPLGVGIVGTIGIFVFDPEGNEKDYKKSLISKEAKRYLDNANQAANRRKISGIAALVGLGTYFFKERLPWIGQSQQNNVRKKNNLGFEFQNGEISVNIFRNHGLE
jgi:enediyne biosynthesis protein E4